MIPSRMEPLFREDRRSLRQGNPKERRPLSEKKLSLRIYNFIRIMKPKIPGRKKKNRIRD